MKIIALSSSRKWNLGSTRIARRLFIEKVKRILLILFSPFTAALLSTNAEGINLRAISEAEAAQIVEAEETAKQQAQEAKSAELSSAVGLETSVADFGEKKIIYKRVPYTPTKETEPADQASNAELVLPSQILAQVSKPVVNLTLYGEVDENGISEIWWHNEEGVRYRIITNANFLYYPGAGQFEDQTTRYSTFMLVAPGHSESPSDDKWRPSLSDFTPGEIEYYILEPKNLSNRNKQKSDDGAFAGITAILSEYVERSEEMRTAYLNRQKIYEAKKAYDAANPVVPRDVQINFAPLRGEDAK